MSLSSTLQLSFKKSKTRSKTFVSGGCKLANAVCKNTAKMVKVTNPDQIKRLLELMELNPSLATNFMRGVPQTDDRQQIWESVANTLNSLGPPTRTEKEWQKVCFDAKFKVKQKLLFNKEKREETGGRRFKPKYLNETDNIIADLLHLNTIVDPEGNVFGGSRPNPSLINMCSITTIETLPTPVTQIEQLTITPETETETPAHCSRQQCYSTK